MTIKSALSCRLAHGFAFAGAGVVTVGVPALVPLFETEALGYQVVMSLFALVATGYWPRFFPLKKSLSHPRSRSGCDSMQAVFSNGPLMVVIGLFTLGCSVLPCVKRSRYYFTYNVGRPDLIGLFFGQVSW